MSKRALIVCAGNEIMGDDGVGIKVGEFLSKEGYNVVNIGTDIFKLASYYNGEDKIIIVDAIVSKKLPPGYIIHLRENEIFQKLDGSFRSAHYMGIIDGIRLLRFLHNGIKDAEIHFVGITVKEIMLGQKLSEEVKDTIPEVIKTIKTIL